MRRYETIVIIDPDLSNEQRLPIFEKLKDLIAKQDGFLVIVDEWGDKRLAYEIKKRSHGYYVCLDFCGTGALVNEIERFFRIDDRVLKYMTVLLDKDADVERIKEQMAEAEASKEQTAQDTTASDDESTADTKLDDSEPEDKQDKAEISESQAVESETTQTGTNEEEK
ncbi:MAG: 30S ribosomal protein S6 [Desulfobacterales bacterium]|uniref:Small ribosomal subunit protein bS6 n=1 Tax=Candidatus Desulfaltia bathyphila TaxID=2841697 RepID=A0A8J6N656_9BACT|nr:30S ribosomal protein S6 [Candidatus Desulfaltia bathyphila]MBL7195473.1 30S ribosomal protein S6 [Desulfobacterales bacterium]MBL7208064.1 30S ribosomal protein S6 [Desulfobacterales bacterium]